VEKRYQVFVSSTYKDLTEERAAVIQAILDLDHLPAGMEMFPSADDDQWTLIRRVIDQSDYYVVVVAGRYGSLSAKGISYTEMEYDYAVEAGVPILGFVLANPDKIEVGKTDQNDEAREKLSEFRAKVESRMVKHFSSAAELGGRVTTGLVHAIRSNPRTGWVRADKALTVETEREILDLRERVATAEKERESAQKALVEDTSELAQGDDEVVIPLLVTGYGDTYQDKKREDLHATTTWDAMFGDIGAVMINEATDKVVRDRVKDHLTGGSCAIPEAEIAKVQGWKSRDIAIYDDDWDLIQVQYRALGLIDKGQRKRTASDSRKYLSLTEKGDRHLAFLRAVRRDADET
jgi:hypothetical protein